MSEILPYFGLSLLLLAVMVKWARQILRQRFQAQVELVQQIKRASRRWDARPQRDLADRIFDSRDWDFVSQYTSLKIRKTFQKERALLAISWLRRAKTDASLAMQQHRNATRHTKNLELYTETKLVLTHVFFLFLCNGLITLIWFHGAFATRQMVLHVLHWNVRLHNKLEDLLLVVDSASQIYSGRNLGPRTL